MKTRRVSHTNPTDPELVYLLVDDAGEIVGQLYKYFAPKTQWRAQANCRVGCKPWFSLRRNAQEWVDHEVTYFRAGEARRRG